MSAPSELPNQHARITCTIPHNQSDDHVILWANDSVTCKSVFILSSLSTIQLPTDAIEMKLV